MPSAYEYDKGTHCKITPFEFNHSPYSKHKNVVRRPNVTLRHQHVTNWYLNLDSLLIRVICLEPLDAIGTNRQPLFSTCETDLGRFLRTVSFLFLLFLFIFYLLI